MKKILLLLLGQLALFYVLYLAAYLMRPVPAVFGLLMWAVLPAAGAVSAFFTVARGVNPYSAWVLPPIAQILASVTATGGHAPALGHALVLCLFCVLGAAASDTRDKKYRRKKK
ncbi:MAG: hypothetical protein J6U63_01885 [Clostridia bacterium]|jgi:hypothetical protein|nr:hypothetical protein [Clostridia bacterium]MBR5751987.1 hypothetical protein [Clostridia bacterium]